MCQKEPLVTLDLSLSITFHLSFLSNIQDQLELLRHSQVFLRRLLKKQNENPEYLLLKNLTVSIWDIRTVLCESFHNKIFSNEYEEARIKRDFSPLALKLQVQCSTGSSSL